MLAKYVSLWLLAEGIVILSGEMTKQFFSNYFSFFVGHNQSAGTGRGGQVVWVAMFQIQVETDP